MPPKKRPRQPITESSPLGDDPGLVDVLSPGTSEGTTGVAAPPRKHGARGGEAPIEVDVQLEAVVECSLFRPCFLVSKSMFG